MFVRKSLPDTPIVLHRYTVEKHGSHNQASHGRRGGSSSSSSGENSGAGGPSSADLRELARLNFGNSGSRKWLKRGDTLDNIKNAEGVRVKISGGGALDGKKGRVAQSAPSGKFHGVKTDDGQEGYISGADLTVISLEKSIDINMEKHGSHDQKTHGRKGGKGGGGGGSSTQAKPNTIMSNEFIEQKGNEASKQMYDASISFKDELEGLRMRAEGGKEIKALNSASSLVEQATKDFMSAKKLKGQEKIGKIQSGLNKYESAMDKISGLDIYRMDVEQTIQNAYDAIPEVITEIGVQSSINIY